MKVVSGDAARWVGVSRVVLSGAGPREVESSRAYRDRLVLKLAGVDDANGAAAIRGSEVAAPAEEVPRLPQDVYWAERLIGALVKDAALGEIGRVVDIVETGGTDLLLVKDAGGVETLVPLAREFVTEVDEASGTISVAIPDGLRGLNGPGGRETA